MLWQKRCIYCDHALYQLANDNLKCSLCHKKFSKKKLNKILFLMECFISNKSANYAAKLYNISYLSAKNYYHDFRIVATNICEERYLYLQDKNVEYEEYYYIEKSKKKRNSAIFDAQNFLTLDYDGYIYTILMPSLEKYKQKFIEDGVDNAYIEEFKKFKRNYKLIKVSKNYNKIVQFWEYFEKNIVIYKGIQMQQFAFFLKEFEFKFNNTQQEAIKLLIKHYFKEEK